MSSLSTPRPSGSRAEEAVFQYLLSWLDQRGIPHRVEYFRLYPYFFICTGVWLIVSRSLLVVAICLRWGWPSLWLALVGLLGGLVDVALNVPLVTWLGARQGKNLLIELGPPEAQQELVLSAHYDTKTEWLDHHQRMFFIKNLRLGIALTVVLGLLGPLDRWFWGTHSPWAGVTFWMGVGLSLPLLYLAWGLGLNLSLGRLRSPSQGAVDNGAACAVLLGLGEHFQQSNFRLQRTRLTLALFGGEEVNMQGSRAYIRSRTWPVPARGLNLEVMAQDGSYVYWERDGNSLKLLPTSSEINLAISAAVIEVTGAPAQPAGPVNSDGASFLFAGIPASTLGTYDRKWVDRGFHSPMDNLGRVRMERLPEGVEILKRFVLCWDELPGKGSANP